MFIGSVFKSSPTLPTFFGLIGLITPQGHGFVCFRSRALLDRFAELMEGCRLVPWTTKRLKIGLARTKNLQELSSLYEGSKVRNRAILWLNRPLAAIKTFERVNRKHWKRCSGPVPDNCIDDDVFIAGLFGGTGSP